MAQSKSEAAARIRSGKGVETFHHETLGHFNISALRQIIVKINWKKPLPIHYCKFSDVSMVDGMPVNAVDYLFANREIDYAHAANFSDRQLKEPLIFLDCPAGTNGMGPSHLLVDGIHRLWERKRRNKEGFRFYLVPLEYAPVIVEHRYKEIPWGKMEVVPGKGLVKRKEV